VESEATRFKEVACVSARPSCFKTSELSVEKQDDSLWLDERLEERDRLITRLISEGRFDLSGKLEKCGEEMLLSCVCCAAKRRVLVHCKKRWCPLCAPMLSVERVMRTRKAVLAMKWPLAVTLTIRNTLTITRAVFARLLKGFRRLRQRRVWKDCVRGGFVACELTNRGRGWHPHLHILCDAEWLSLTTAPPAKWMSKAQKKNIFERAAKELEKEWCECIGQKTASVRVRRKYGKAGTVAAQCEAMKYAVKPGALLECESSASEAIDAMTGTRLFSGFGSCYRLKLDDDAPSESRPCESCGEHGGWLPTALVESQRERERESRLTHDRDDRRRANREMNARHKRDLVELKAAQLAARLSAVPKVKPTRGS